MRYFIYEIFYIPSLIYVVYTVPWVVYCVIVNIVYIGLSVILYYTNYKRPRNEYDGILLRASTKRLGQVVSILVF